MSIQFKAIEKGQPGADGGGEKKFYATVVTQGETSTDELIEKMKEHCSLHKADIIRMIIALQLAIQEELVKGKIVRLDWLGSFYLSISSERANSAEQVNATGIKKTRIIYRPDKRFSKAIAGASFQKVKG